MKAIAKALGVATLLLMGGLAASRLGGQPPQGAGASRPAFEVASVKINKSGDPRTMRSNIDLYSLDTGGARVGGLVSIVNMPLRPILEFAYKLPRVEALKLIFGLQNDIDSERFDIEARVEGNLATDQVRLMVQSLLADRFKLMMHHETRQLPVYALVLSKNDKAGPQLIPSSDEKKCFDPAAGLPSPQRPGVAPVPPCGDFIVLDVTPGARRMVGAKSTMQMLAGILSVLPGIDRPVVDRTGLSGVFDVTLDFTREMPPGSPIGTAVGTPDPSLPPSIVTALQEQLGLKLESATGPVGVVVIDHAEQPTEN